jgi:hypothetical protein
MTRLVKFSYLINIVVAVSYIAMWVCALYETVK